LNAPHLSWNPYGALSANMVLYAKLLVLLTLGGIAVASSEQDGGGGACDQESSHGRVDYGSKNSSVQLLHLG
jgi:hypothetical protein